MRKYLLYLLLSFIPLTGFGQILQEGFNDITTLTGWTMTNQSAPVGTTNWFQGNAATFTGHEGGDTSYIGANFNNTTGGTGTISNWLITPTVNVKDGDVITFYTRTATGSTWADRLQVRMSQGAAFTAPSGAEGLGSFTTLLQDINPTLTGSGYPQVWTEISITVAGVGTTAVPVNVGLRYYVTNAGPSGTNSNYIGIDTFSIVEGDGGEPTEGNCDLEGTTVGGPVWDRPLATGTGMSSVGIGVTYHVYGPFTVDTAGAYDFSSTQDGWDGMIFVYQNAFDPADPLTNYLAGNDDGDGGIGTSDVTATLAVGTEYFLITTGFDSEEEGPFTNTITGPGTVSCGTVEPPAEGCLDADNGQYPSSTYTPACLGISEDITTLAWTGEYSVVAVTGGAEYTFSVSDASYFITIGDEAGATVLASGTGSVTWTAPASGNVRFYTHFDSDCNFDSSTFLTRSVLCGEPIVISEPDFPCFQGDGLASNGPEDGLNISPNTAFRNADDFIVDEAFTVQQVRLNILSLSEISEVTLNFRADNAGSPGDVEETVTMAPSAQRVVGSAFGFNAYEVTFDLATPFEFGAGTYWLQPEAVNQDPADGAIYWEATSTGSTGAISQTSGDSGASWGPNEFGYQLVFFVAGECGEVPAEDCEVAYTGTFQDGLGNLQTLQIANDFTVAANTEMDVEQVRVNLFSNVTTGSVYIYEDASGMPGTLIDSHEGITPTSQELVGSAFGFNIYEVVLDLPVAVTATAGTTQTIFWVGISTTAGSEGTPNYWEAADATTNGIAQVSTDGGVTWAANSFGQDGAFVVAGTCGELGVSEMDSFDFAYYPNPVKDELNITSQKLVQYVSVYNLAGQQVSTQKLNVNNGKVSTSSLSPGVYVFRAILDGGQVETFKVIKK